MRRVLVTFAGGHLAIGICEALQAAPEPVYLVGVDSSSYHTNLAVTDEVHLAPRADEPDFIEILGQIASETNVDFIWPMHDAEVELVSKNASGLPARTWLPPHAAVKISRSKLETYKRLKAAGVPTPVTHLVDTPENLKDVFNKFGEVWIRAITGAGGSGALKTDNIDHAMTWLDMHDGWGGFTAAKVLPGPSDFLQDSIWDRGELVAMQSQTRLIRGTPSISLPGVTARGAAISEAPEIVDDIGLNAVKAVMPEPHGIFRVDMFTDSDGIPNVTEVDAGRFTTNGPSNWYPVGVNLPQAVLKLAFGEPVDFETPLINPYPTDTMYVAAINRPRALVKRSISEKKEEELRRRRS